MIDFNSPTPSLTTTSGHDLEFEGTGQDTLIANVDSEFNDFELTSDSISMTQDSTIPDLNSILPSQDSQLGEAFFPAMNIFEPLSAGFLHDAEMIRQQHLEDEFGVPATELNVEAALSFREDADEDATLSSFWDSIY